MTFLISVMRRGYSEDEIFAVLHESERNRKRRRVLAKVNETVAAHRLQQMKDLQALEKLATWRRMNGFDRVMDDKDNWFHGPHSLPPTPEEFTARLWSEVKTLKDAISMSAKTRPWQKSTEFVDGLKGKLSDEELAAIKRYVKRRSHKAAQVTGKPVSTVQHCIPCSQTSEPSSDVCAIWESNEGKMDPELKELEPPSASTSLETPGQQCPPNGETWEKGRTIADGYLLVGMGSNQGGEFLQPGNAWTREPVPRVRQHMQTSLPQRNTLVREPRQLRHRQNSGTRQLAKKTSNSTPVGKERRHRFGTRL